MTVSPAHPAELAIEPLPGPFDLTLDDLPGSKSLTNRALLLAALAEGTSTLSNVLFSDDTRVMLDALGRLGFELRIDEPARTATVHGRGSTIPIPEAELFLGNAGTAMRFLTAACCLGPPGSAYTLDGVPRMRQRPIGELVDALRHLGAKIDYLGDEGFPPLRVHGGGLPRKSTKIDPSRSSQFVSALMMVCPFAGGGVDEGEALIRFEDHASVVSEPYIEMTGRLMNEFGGQHRKTEDGFAIINTRLRATDIRIEPDASNASYFLAAAAICPESRCTVKGLNSRSVQGDQRFLEVLVAMRAGTEDSREGMTVYAPDHRRLRGVTRDLNQMPDMAQTLAVVALFAEGPTTIRNVGNLRIKETDRMAALKNELTKLGAKVTVSGDDITIEPPSGNVLRHRDGEPISRQRPAVIDTYDDHRMAMSFAVAGLRQAGVVIRDPACVNKTFPAYFEYLDRLRTAAAPA